MTVKKWYYNITLLDNLEKYISAYCEPHSIIEAVIPTLATIRTADVDLDENELKLHIDNKDIDLFIRNSFKVKETARDFNYFNIFYKPNTLIYVYYREKQEDNE